MKGEFTKPAFLVTSVILLIVLFIRTTRGIDLTDEMQYYGEIKGLLTSGKLFTNDLFIQQSVYVLFYPVFYIYHLFFGYDGFVFFGRIIMSTLSVVLFFYAYRKLLSFGFSPAVASLTSFSLIFAVPFHGIFAPSYNTISQMLWIVFALKFFEWKRNGVMFWGLFPIVMFFVHPTSAVVTSLLVLTRQLVDRDFSRIRKLLMVYVAGVLLASPVIFYFAHLQEYLASIAFSSGYGVGTAFFSSGKQVIILTLVFCFMIAGLFLSRFTSSERLSALMILSLVVVTILLLSGKASYGYAHSVARALSFLSAVAYGLALANIPADDTAAKSKIHWLVVLLLMFATTLGISSSNGVGQATGAFMVSLPILLGIAVTFAGRKEAEGKSSILNIGSVMLIPVLFVAHWVTFPYREDRWYSTNSTLHEVSAFKFIKTSQERSVFIDQMRQILKPVTLGKRTLIVSEYPALYFALDTSEETCMLYMHSLTSDKSEQVLMECLNKKSPEVVIDVLSENKHVTEDSRIKRVMKTYYTSRGFNCTSDPIQFNSGSEINPRLLKLTVCKEPE